MPGSVMPASKQELQRRYGNFYSRRTALDPARVPAPLRPLVPYAEVWGVTDDVEREELVEASPPVARQDLLELIATYDPQFDAWLAGPEADSPPSPEYLAFSAMRMASYFI